MTRPGEVARPRVSISRLYCAVAAVIVSGYSVRAEDRRHEHERAEAGDRESVAPRRGVLDGSRDAGRGPHVVPVRGRGRAARSRSRAARAAPDTAPGDA